jgi:hypothetical protein
MRTKVRLDQGLLELAGREARLRGTTLTALLEHHLRLALRPPQAASPQARVHLPVSRATGGLLPGVELDNSANLNDRIDNYRQNNAMQWDRTGTQETGTEIALLRQDLRHFRESFSTDCELFLASMTIRFGVMLIAWCGLLFIVLMLALPWAIR